MKEKRNLAIFFFLIDTHMKPKYACRTYVLNETFIISWDNPLQDSERNIKEIDRDIEYHS